MFDSTAITTAGAALLAQWVTGSELSISKAACGTGTDVSLAAMTQLHDQKQLGSIVKVARNANSVTVSVQIHAAETAYTMQQVGIWAAVDGGSEILLAVYQDANGISVPAESAHQEWAFTFHAEIAASSQGTLSVTIDPNAYVSQSMLDEALEGKQDAIEVTGMLKRNAQGEIVEAQRGVDYDTSSGAFHASSSTASGTAAKTVSIPDLTTLKAGNLFVIKFSNANTAANPSLKINSLTAKSIVSPGQSTLDSRDYWKSGEYVMFLYDGTHFVLLDRFIRYVAQSLMGIANGIATLGADGKVLASQLRGGFVVQANAPSDTSLLWIDANRVMRYYDSGAWKTIVPTWG